MYKKGLNSHKVSNITILLNIAKKFFVKLYKKGTNIRNFHFDILYQFLYTKNVLF